MVREDGAAAKARAGGFVTLLELSRWCGIKEDTLKRWVDTRPVAFECLVLGAAERRRLFDVENGYGK